MVSSTVATTLAGAQSSHGQKIFLASNKEEALYSRMALWGLAIIGLIVALFRGASPVALLVIFTVALSLADIMLIRQYRVGRRIVTLTSAGVSFPTSSGEQHIAWADVRNVSIKEIHQQPFLQIKRRILGEHTPKRFRPWQRDPAHVQLSLASLTVGDLDLLVRDLEAHLRTYTDLSAPSIFNPVLELQRFMERVKNFAPTPWVTWFLAIANAVVWLAMLTDGATWSNTPIGVLYGWGGSATSAVQGGEYWRLFASLFLHASVFHLIINIAALLSAGVLIERVIGPGFFALLYLFSGIVGGAVGLYFMSPTHVAVGSSGAIFGVVGALWGILYLHRDEVPKSFSSPMIVSLSFFVAYSVIQALTRNDVDLAAHIGGLIVGLSLVLVLPIRLGASQRHVNPLKIGVLVSAVVACIVGTLISFAPPSTVNMAQSVASADVLANGMAQFAQLLGELDQEEKAVRAGRMSVKESDERSRRVYAPRMASVLAVLRSASLPPSDPRQPIIGASIRLADLLAESLAMESVFAPGSDVPQPADPVRAERIKHEIEELMRRQAK